MPAFALIITSIVRELRVWLRRGDDMKNHALAWELLGAAVGAGLASGRELASFFACYGKWGWLGIVLAATVILALLPAEIPMSWQGRWPKKLWLLLQGLLMIVTGGAMLAGAGEVTALMLPVHGAYWAGIAATLALAWLLAHRTHVGLAWVSMMLLCAMTVLIIAGILLPPMRAARIDEMHPVDALWRGMAYGGFNAALMRPVMEHRGAKPAGMRRGCILIALLLSAGTALLQRHPALIPEPMPFVRLASCYGPAGYGLCAVCLYLAILSTLTACIRALGAGVLPLGALLAAALVGFSGTVGTAYPVLGGICTIMLVAMRLANFRNSARKAFISLRNML